MAAAGQLTVTGDSRYSLESVTAVTAVTEGRLNSGNQIDHG
jgi:hypothetical protein